MDSPSTPDPCRSPGRCRRRGLGDRYLGVAPFWRTGAPRSWLWLLPSPQAWVRRLLARPRATRTTVLSDLDQRMLLPPPQSARSRIWDGLVLEKKTIGSRLLATATSESTIRPPR